MHHGGLGTLRHIVGDKNGDYSIEPRAQWKIGKGLVDVNVVWASKTLIQAMAIYMAPGHNTTSGKHGKPRGSPGRVRECVTKVDDQTHTRTTTHYYVVSVGEVEGRWKRTGVPSIPLFEGTKLSTKPMRFGKRVGKSLRMEPAARLVEYKAATYAMKGDFSVANSNHKASNIDVTGRYLGAGFGGPPDGYPDAFA